MLDPTRLQRSSPTGGSKPPGSAEFLNAWLEQRALEKEWGYFDLVIGFLPAFKIITHDTSGEPRPDLSATRYDRAEAKYMSPVGCGSVIYAPQPHSWAVWEVAQEKWIAEGEGKTLALVGLGLPVLGIRGCHNWHAKGSLDLLPELAARIRPGDRVPIAIDGDWKTNKLVHRGLYLLMQAIRAVGGIPELVDLPAVPGMDKVGIDDLIALWRRQGVNVKSALAQLARLPEIPSPFIVDLKRPLDTAENFIAARYSHDDGPTLVHWQGDFYRWKGVGWETYPEEQIREDLYEWVRENGSVPNQTNISRLVDALRAAGQIKVKSAPGWLTDLGPAPTDLLACANGLLNLRTRELIPASPRYFNLNWSTVAFDAETTAPRWLQFLEEIYPGDVEARQCLQEFMGYSLTEDTSQQKAIALIGAKRSGKGTISRTLQALVGPASCCAPTLQSMGETFGLQTWIGKKVAIVEDARTSVKNNAQAMVERVLTITGEDTQYVDRKHRDPWEGRLRARLWLVSNMLPATQDKGAALASRFLIINHAVSFFGREDTGLEATLKSELPGILNWALDGLARLRTRGRFIQPASGTMRAEEWERMNSPVLAFVKDRCELGAGYYTEKKQLRFALQAYANDMGMNPNMLPDDSHFTEELRAATGNAVTTGQRTVNDKKGVRVFVGIRTRDTQANTTQNLL